MYVYIYIFIYLFIYYNYLYIYIYIYIYLIYIYIYIFFWWPRKTRFVSKWWYLQYFTHILVSRCWELLLRGTTYLYISIYIYIFILMYWNKLSFFAVIHLNPVPNPAHLRCAGPPQMSSWQRWGELVCHPCRKDLHVKQVMKMWNTIQRNLYLRTGAHGEWNHKSEARVQSLLQKALQRNHH